MSGASKEPGGSLNSNKPSNVIAAVDARASSPAPSTSLRTTAAELVHGNDLCMDKIFGYVEKKKDLVSCTMTCKIDHNRAAKELYRDFTVKDGSTMYKNGCSLVCYECLPLSIRYSE